MANNQSSEMEKENKIIGKIEIKTSDLKERIINSYENAKKRNKKLKGIENEKEIKMCEIFINNKKINFTYDYNFPKRRKLYN